MNTEKENNKDVTYILVQGTYCLLGFVVKLMSSKEIIRRLELIYHYSLVTEQYNC